MIRLGEMGLRHNDGAVLGEPEQPALLSRAVVTLMRGRGVSLQDIASALRFSERQLEDVLGGQLPPIADLAETTPEARSSVVPTLARVHTLRPDRDAAVTGASGGTLAGPQIP
jgi:hypothetical protein